MRNFEIWIFQSYLLYLSLSEIERSIIDLDYRNETDLKYIQKQYLKNHYIFKQEFPLAVAGSAMRFIGWQK
jgi:hypothetical protein